MQHSLPNPHGSPAPSIPVVPQGFSNKRIAEEYIVNIIYLYQRLLQFPNLEPTPEISDVFTRLVAVCIKTPAEAIAEIVLTDPRIVEITPHLRELCSEGECRLEAYWAEEIGKLKTEAEVNSRLCEFPYYSNYVELVEMEMFALRSVSRSEPRSFAFIGSGPLPLTSIRIANSLNRSNLGPLQIHNIDCNQQAISLSTALCQKLGQNTKLMTFQCAEAKEGISAQTLGTFDVVYLAALVGSTKAQKDEIIRAVSSRMKPGALLIMRSAHSLRSLLYPVIEVATDLRNSNLEPLLVVHPYNYIVNSIVIARVIDA